MNRLPALPPIISKLVRVSATESDGEALGAVRALGRTLKGSGLDFNDLAERIELVDRQPEVRIVYRERMEFRTEFDSERPWVRRLRRGQGLGWRTQVRGDRRRHTENEQSEQREFRSEQGTTFG